MKRLITLAVALVSLLCFTACGSKKAEAQPEQPKTLVLYYSQTGTTKAVAEEIAKTLKADIEEIALEQPYDGTYAETIQRCLNERADSVYPTLLPLKSNVKDYERVFLGYPIWFGTYAPPIYSLVQSTDFDGVEIVPFCTFGSGGLEASSADLKAALPGATIKEGYGVRNARLQSMPAEVNLFLVANEYIDGPKETMPAFTEAAPVTETEAAIFDAACGNYQFPLGTPVTVGHRPNGANIEYEYTVVSTDQNGADVNSTIYVIAPLDTTKAPEFTRVVR